MEKIAEVIISKKLPALLDVRDESTEITRIVCEFKAGTDPQLIMAYLYKQTPLSVNVQVNLTCLGARTKATLLARHHKRWSAILS